ncbi:MAG: TetR/AcrR family transcriptional regulator [Methylophilus sp.]
MANEVKKLRGRPRVFDMDEALDKALKIFWKRGYEGASLSELIKELSINKPSLYAAFGNKEELFLKALSRYASGPVAFIKEVVKEPTSYQVAESFLFKAAEFLTDPTHPQGCMIVQGALSTGDSAELIKNILIKYRSSYENLLTERFDQAKSDGDLPDWVNANDLAKYLATIHQGMSVQATSGATKQQLINISNIALRSWPSVSL